MALVHQVKRIQFLNRQVPICLQNENGPCPLLALVNVLLLRGTLSLHEDRSEISSQQLIELVGNLIIERNPPVENAAQQAILSKTIEDVIELLPSLQFGLDVNVRFSGIGDFEFDSRISVFDLLDVNLYHGWALDPQDTELSAIIGQLSYNQLMDKLVAAQESGEAKDSEAMVQALQEAELVDKFLHDTASQLTYYGLLQLHNSVKERELCAFFRNNHFSVMYRMDGNLYLLVTDQGYKLNNAIAWEHLTEIDGNTEMVSPSFGNPNEYLSPSDLGITSASDRKIDADQLLAMQMQKEENDQTRVGNRRQNQQQQGQRRPQSPKSSSDCVLL